MRLRYLSDILHNSRDRNSRYPIVAFALCTHKLKKMTMLGRGEVASNPHRSLFASSYLLDCLSGLSPSLSGISIVSYVLRKAILRTGSKLHAGRSRGRALWHYKMPVRLRIPLKQLARRVSISAAPFLPDRRLESVLWLAMSCKHPLLECLHESYGVCYEFR